MDEKQPLHEGIGHRKRTPLLGAVGVVALLLSFTACSNGGGSQTGGPTTSGTASAAPVATMAATAVPTSAAPVTCAALLPGGGPATAGSGFSDVLFPSGSLSSAIVPHSSGVGQWTILLFNACTPGSTVAGVQSFFATQLPGNGWKQSATLPFNGSYPASCGDPFCWGKDTAPRFVGLENVTDAGNGTITYRIRLFTPPPTPQCPVGPYVGPSGPFEPWLVSAAVGVPAPPLGEHGPATGFDQNGYAQDPNDNMCVAGNATSVAAYFNFAMSYLGWAHGTAPSGCVVGTSGTIWRKGANMIALNVASGANVINGYSFGYSVCLKL